MVGVEFLTGVGQVPEEAYFIFAPTQDSRLPRRTGTGDRFVLRPTDLRGDVIRNW